MNDNTRLNLDQGLVQECKSAAERIVEKVLLEINNKTTSSVERTIARLLGIDGVNEDDIPFPNLIVDHLIANNGIRSGLSYWLGNAMIQTGKSPQQIAGMVNDGSVNLVELPQAEKTAIYTLMIEECGKALDRVSAVRKDKELKRARLGENPPPHAYVLTATGNVYEDVIHAIADARYGADIVAVIRSTAQSLLDYVPFGPTTEGYGGTYATQENFRIMRKALDDWAEENKRYVRLSSFCSGLCMPEIAAMGALEGLDNMANDALYGILYRDINMIRTFIDQKMSRMINGFSGTVINTGEDNYLRTADAVSAAHSVVTSQLINYHFARRAGLKGEHIGIGNAFEITPNLKNGLLYEWAQALLTRELFPDCKTKYMPPTKHMNGNIFRTHAVDTMFNFITIATRQDIQTIGVPTEGFYTPIIHDRTISLENVKYVFNNAADIYDEISFKEGGIIQTRAKEVLSETLQMLHKIEEIGLFTAIEKKFFGDVGRSISDGKGREGVFEKDLTYFNPFTELILGEQ
ncbi:MAG: lysine 5,6-aminomutase subunit alpha [Bacteroidota bacterium]